MMVVAVAIAALLVVGGVIGVVVHDQQLDSRDPV